MKHLLLMILCCSTFAILPAADQSVPAKSVGTHHTRVQQSPNTQAVQAAYNQAVLLMREKKHDLAADSFEKILLRVEPKSNVACMVHFNLGNLYIDLNKPAAAEEHFSTVLEPQFPYSYERLARAQYLQGKHEEAIKNYTIALEHGSSLVAKTGVALCLLALGRNDEAQQLLSGAIIM